MYNEDMNNEGVKRWHIYCRSAFHGFDVDIFMQGTEESVLAYAKKEIGNVTSYYEISDEEDDALFVLDIGIYIAPEV